MRKKHREYSEKELEYICKFYEVDGAKSVACTWGRSAKTISDKIVKLRKQGLFEYYKNLNKHW